MGQQHRKEGSTASSLLWAERLWICAGLHCASAIWTHCARKCEVCTRCMAHSVVMHIIASKYIVYFNIWMFFVDPHINRHSWGTPSCTWGEAGHTDTAGATLCPTNWRNANFDQCGLRSNSAEGCGTGDGPLGQKHRCCTWHGNPWSCGDVDWSVFTLEASHCVPFHRWVAVLAFFRLCRNGHVFGHMADAVAELNV